MEVNKYGIMSFLIGILLFFGTYFFWYSGGNAPISSAGWTGLLLTMFYGGLLWLGVFFLLIGILMLIL